MKIGARALCSLSADLYLKASIAPPDLRALIGRTMFSDGIK